MTALAHESRNALQQIQASAEVLELEVGCNPQAQKDIQSIYRAARDLHGLLEEVRLFAAPIHLDLRRCDIAAIWLDAWKQVAHQFENKKGSLACEQPSRMPMIEVDAARMGRIFRNLFQNAFEAQDGPIEVQLTARWNEDRSELEILIADNGPGLGSIDASKIFEPFFTTKSNGTGLGLPIVKRIVDAHHGRIEVLSSIGRGTAFAITLPIDRPQMSKDYEL